MTPEAIARATVFEDARRLATKGHRTWIVFRERDGTFSKCLWNSESIKRAMLAVGTQGRFNWVDPSGVWNICRVWSYALHLLQCARSHEKFEGPSQFGFRRSSRSNSKMSRQPSSLNLRPATSVENGIVRAL